jgi:hypothetical protein
LPLRQQPRVLCLLGMRVWVLVHQALLSEPFVGLIVISGWYTILLLE